MLRRPPRFPLVLSLLVAAAAIAILLIDTAPSSPAPPPTLGTGPSHACAASRAAAQVTDQSAVVVAETVHAPVSVTESAPGPAGFATVTRSEVVSATFRATRPVSVTERAVDQATACAGAGSSTAARTAALRTAYAKARLAAHLRAARAAQRGLRKLEHEMFPAVLAGARARASASAHELAVTAGQKLATQALAEARRRAA
jgi:hypothetical protein